MANSIENKVVSATFDGSKMQSGIEKAIHALDKLKAAMKFDKVGSGFNDLQKQADNLNLKKAEAGVSGMGSKFSAMSTAAVAGLTAIGVAAVAVGAKLAKELTLDPMIAGFQEYETNINSIQTILANTDSKGSTLQDVNGALDTLNEYSDKTIYNFSQMARNIGTFTAAGVDLDTSTAAIKGIANVAAVSGSNAEQASTAMYQLSQALANGSVKLMDWNSVVNAGMGGEVFQKSLFETGKALGTLKDVPVGQTFEDWKKKGNSFRESLNEGWLTSDVLTQTLDTFTGDLTLAQIEQMGYTKAQAKELYRMGQVAKAAASEIKTGTQFMQVMKESLQSGWSASFRIIIGDFNEAKQLFSGFGGVLSGWIGKQADARNKMLNVWKIFGGRNALIEGFVKGWQALRSVLDPIRMAFRTLFPKKTAKELLIYTDRFRDFMDKLKMGGKGQERLVKIFGAVFGALKFGITIISTAVKVVWAFFKILAQTLGGPLFSLLGTLGQGLGNLFKGLTAGLKGGGGGIVKALGWIQERLEGVGRWLTKAADWVGEFLASLDPGAILEWFGDRIEWVGDQLKKLAPVVDKIKSVFSGLKEAFLEWKDNFEGVGPSFDKVKAKLAAFSISTEKIAELWDKFVEKITGGGGDGGGVAKKASAIPDALTNAWESFKSRLQQLGTDIKGFFGGINDFVNDFIDNLGSGTKDLGDIISSALGSDAFDKVLKAGGLGLLGNFLLTLRRFSKEGIKFDFLGGESERVFTEVGDSLKAFQTKVKADALKSIAIALAILVGSLAVLSLLPADKISSGLGNLGLMLASLTAAMIAMDKGMGTGFKAGGMAVMLLGLGAALLVMSIALGAIGLLDMEQIAKGMFGVIGTLIGLAGVMKLIDDKEAASTGLAFLLISFSLKKFADAILIFAAIPMGAMIKGLFFIGVTLAGLAGIMHLFPDDMLKSAAGLLVAAAATMVIAKALEVLAKISVGQMIVAVMGLAITLGILIVAMLGFGLPNVQLGMYAMGLAAVALLAIAGALYVLGQLSIAQIATGLLAIVAIFAILGIAAIVMLPVIPIMILLGAALLIAGAGLLFFGAGLLLTAMAMDAFGKAGPEALETFSEVLKTVARAIPEFITNFVQGILDGFELFLGQVPKFMDLIEQAILSFLEMLMTLTPKFLEWVNMLGLGIIGLIATWGPALFLTGLSLLLTFLNGLANNVEPIVTAITTLIVNLLAALVANRQRIIDAGLDALDAILQGLASDANRIVQSAIKFLLALAAGIGDNVNLLIEGGIQTLTDFLNGLADALANRGELIDAIDRVGSEAMGLIVDAMVAFFQLDDILAVGSELVAGIKQGISNGWDTFMTWIDEQIAKIPWAIRKALGIESPSKVTAVIGEQLMQGFSVGIDKGMPQVLSDGEVAAKALIDSVAATINTIPALLAEMDELNPTITPVLDMTEVQRQAREFAGINGGTVAPTVSLANAGVLADTVTVGKVEAKSTDAQAGGGVSFVQNNYSPEALSTADIYRQTKSQIAIARKELEG
jgi:tape measure domain-containing protein